MLASIKEVIEDQSHLSILIEAILQWINLPSIYCPALNRMGYGSSEGSAWFTAVSCPLALLVLLPAPLVRFIDLLLPDGHGGFQGVYAELDGL